MVLCTTRVHAPIAPGLVSPIDVADVQAMHAGELHVPGVQEGSLALDGERELAFRAGERVGIRLIENAFRTVDVSACMRHAARHGLLTGETAPAAAGWQDDDND